MHNSRLEILVWGSIGGKARGVPGLFEPLVVPSSGSVMIVSSESSCELMRWMQAWEAMNGRSIGVVKGA